MTAPRLVLLLAAILTPAVSYRLGGTNLWIANGLGAALAAACALYVLWQDGLLDDVIKPKGLDISTGFLAAALLYTTIALVWTRLIAPVDQLGGLLRRCTLTGPVLPRLDPHGITAFWELVRLQTCRGYGTSLGLTGPMRGIAIVVIAMLEEIAWRGGVQQFLAEKLGTTRGWIAAAFLYSLAHLATGNVMLAALALIAGLVWGGLFRFRRRLAPGIFSHAVFSYFLFHKLPLVSF